MEASGVGVRAVPLAGQVTPLELFFDLVFVFAVSQLSHHLLAELSWRCAGQALVMLGAAFSVWASTSWNASLPDMGRRHETIAIVGVMPLGLLMNAGITRAFDDAPGLFAVPFLLCHVQRAVTPWLAARDPLLREHFTRQLLWIAASSVLWIVGALASPDERLAWWAAAAALDLAGTWSAHWLPGRRLESARVSVSPDHMLERARAFLIIALGEAILAVGTGIAGQPVTPAGFAAGLLALGAIAALWGVYFAGTDQIVEDQAERTSNPLGLVRLVVNSQLVNLAALICIAAAVQLIVSDPSRQLGGGVAGLLFGGAAAYLVVEAVYLHQLTGRVPVTRAVALAALVVGGVAAGGLHASGLVAIAVASCVLGALCWSVVVAQRVAAA